MKKVFLTLAATAMLTSCVPAQANGLFDTMATSGWTAKSPTAKYKLNTYGYNVRVYEWTPKDNPNYRCVFVAGHTNSTGVACYPTTDAGHSSSK